MRSAAPASVATSAAAAMAARRNQRTPSPPPGYHRMFLRPDDATGQGRCKTRAWSALSPRGPSRQDDIPDNTSDHEERLSRRCGDRRRPHRHAARAARGQASGGRLSRDLRRRSGARQGAGRAGRRAISTPADNDEIIARPEVNAVIVSTPEGEHAAPVLQGARARQAGAGARSRSRCRCKDADAILETLRADRAASCASATAAATRNASCAPRSR